MSVKNRFQTFKTNWSNLTKLIKEEGWPEYKKSVKERLDLIIYAFCTIFTVIWAGNIVLGKYDQTSLFLLGWSLFLSFAAAFLTSVQTATYAPKTNVVIIHKDTPTKVVFYCFLIGLAFMTLIYLA